MKNPKNVYLTKPVRDGTGGLVLVRGYICYEKRMDKYHSIGFKTDTDDQNSELLFVQAWYNNDNPNAPDWDKKLDGSVGRYAFCICTATNTVDQQGYQHTNYALGSIDFAPSAKKNTQQQGNYQQNGNYQNNGGYQQGYQKQAQQGYQKGNYQNNGGYQQASAQRQGGYQQNGYQKGNYQNNGGYQKAPAQQQGGYQQNGYQQGGNYQNKGSYQKAPAQQQGGYQNNGYQSATQAPAPQPQYDAPPPPPTDYGNYGDYGTYDDGGYNNEGGSYGG